MSEVPDDRCGYTWPEDFETDADPNHQSCCWRPALSDTDRCAWHADPDTTNEKTIEALQAVRPNQEIRDLTEPYIELLDGAVLAGCDIGDSISLSRVSLRDADLTDTRLREADLTDANLEDAILTGAVLKHAKFRDTQLADAQFEYTIPNDKDISPHEIIAQADLSGSDLTDADLSSADLTDADLSSADLDGADLSDAGLMSADLSGARLKHVDLSNVYLRYADLTDANLKGANLSKADLTDADLTVAHLAKTDFTDSNLRGADLTNANLYAADLTEANIRGTDLTGAVVHDLTVENCTVDTQTKFGSRLPLPHIGAYVLRILNNSAIRQFRQNKVTRYAREYHDLRVKFSNMAHDNIARELYFLERKARTMAAFPYRPITFLGGVVSGLLTGYGVRPSRVLISSIVILAVTTLQFSQVGVGIEEWNKIYNFFGYDLGTGALYYSVVTFVTSPPHPPEHGGGITRLMITLETYIGTVLTVLLGYVLGNRSRI